VSSIARIVARVWSRLAGSIDDGLPMPPEERAERDWIGETSAEESDRRQLRIRMRMLEKEGKGGRR
jgi:hypothetical protein